MKSTAIFFRVEPELKQRLQDLARAQRRSVASLILLLIEEKIKLGEVQDAGITTTAN